MSETFEMPLPGPPWERSFIPETPTVPIRNWGRDHWQTLLYIEARVTDKRGILDNRQMRCHLRRHRSVVGIGFEGPMDGSGYPTRLRDGSELADHDDWDCLDDMAALGLLDSCWRFRRYGEVFGFAEVMVVLSPAGQRLAGLARAHKATGRPWAEFSPEEPAP